ncbi:hypothetical protein [Klebsiella aerogenes]|uniref:hypothetical protein n=1 Tax=Klebsiella aerogenes TaxID=548 RepID=UPI00388E4795
MILKSPYRKLIRWLRLSKRLSATGGGVRMTGGGFGGCIVALIPEALVEKVQQAVAAQYEAKNRH